MITDDSHLSIEHKKLVDIADSLYNADIRPEDMKPTYQELYAKYGADYFDKVLKDCQAIDSQINTNNVNDLIDEYVAKCKDFEP